MATAHGKNTKIWMSKYDLSDQFSEVEVTSERSEGEDTAFTDTSKSFVLMLRSGEASASGFFDGATGKVDEVLDTLSDGTKHPFTVAWAGGTVGNNATLGNNVETQLDEGGGVKDVVPVSYSARVNGAPGYGYLLENVTRSANGNAAGVDFGVLTTATVGRRFIANLHVPTVTALTAGQVTIKTGTDNITFASTLATFAALTTTTTSEHIAGTAGADWRYARSEYTTHAGTSAVIIVSLARMN